MLHITDYLGNDSMDTTKEIIELPASHVKNISESTTADIGILLGFASAAACALYLNRNMLKAWLQQ